MASIRRSGHSTRRTYRGKHRREHWHRDHQIYFITARCRGQYPAFADERAKTIFWDYISRCTKEFGFTPWVTSLFDNHYHTVGYLERGENLAPMMRRLHGAVAKLVNDILEENGVARLKPFWKDTNTKNYFDGCLRDEKQGRLTYRYVLTQAERHRITHDWRMYAHTRVDVALEKAISMALERRAFLVGVPYRRYGGYGRV